MSSLANKIEAHERTISEVLDDKKYIVDYFQREFRWEERHIEQLVSDLTAVFLDNYKPEHKPKEVANYNSYYLGPFVISIKDGQRSIIDGQQRLTSLTLLLIYLNHLQKECGLSKKLDTLIYSELYDEKTFNINVEERINCLNQLYTEGIYQPTDSDDESTVNMAARYQDIVKNFPDEIKNEALPFFIDWLKYNVVLVEIIAYSDENAYMIFETMNDRGLNLAYSEMLKGFLLSRFDKSKRQKANDFWRDSMQKLHVYDKNEDQRFFQAWLRGKYAVTIRPGKADSKNEDFEKIGTRFHNWFKDNLDKIGLDENDPASFENFINRDFKFFLRAYFSILKAERNFNQELEHIFYIYRWGIANSLSYPLLLSSLTTEDDEATVNRKMNLVAKYIEIFVVRRAVNFHKFASSSIRYTMYTLVKEIRNANEDELALILKGKLNEMEESFVKMDNFRLHGQNGYFVKFLLSRITSFIEQQAGLNSSFSKFFINPGGKPFEIEHIWADKFEEHKDEFEQKNDFQEYRNRLGDLILLPNGTNQSFHALPYDKKLPHYVKENLLAQSLCEISYDKNPNFRNMIFHTKLPFQFHTTFKKQDITARQNLYKEICNLIWSL